jgi:hypothetical protein
VTTTGLPEAIEGRRRHRRVPGGAGPRIGLGVLLVGIAVATVVVPPLITPSRRLPATASVATPSPVLVPPAIGPATVTTAPSAPSGASGPAPCASREGSVTATPSCTLYATALGNGWSVAGDGLKVLPGEVVPGTKQVAMRVERSRPAVPATTLVFTARTPVGIDAAGRLRLRVWGGRQYGTVLQVSRGPDGTGSITLTAAADKWTTYTIRLGDLGRGRSVTRIELAVAADQVPNVNRFFLDDVALVG